MITKEQKRKIINELSKIDVLYISVGFSGFKMASDKNFYIDLFEELTRSGLKLLVISLSDPKQGMIYFDNKTQPYPIIHLKRPFHLKNPSRYWKLNKNFISYRHHHNLFWEHFERNITLRFWNTFIKKIISATHPGCIHLLDAFIGMPRFYNVPRIITQSKTEIKNPFIYKHYIKSIFRKNSTGILFNPAQKKYFPLPVLNRSKFIIQPWGLKFRNREETASMSARSNFLTDPRHILFLWAGYIQQIGYNDFLFAKNFAETAVRFFPNIEFIFSFKPEIDIALPESSERIKFIKPGQDFKQLMNASDILFSPVKRRATVIGPPLTWIEYISLKKPILTTEIDGIDSYFRKNESIFLFRNEIDFISIMTKISKKEVDLDVVGQNAFRVYKEHFVLDSIAENYIKIYRDAVRP
jgi:hypothetical protein